MKYGVKVIMELLEEKIGKRLTRQILCVLLLIMGMKKSEIKTMVGVSPTSLYKYDKLIEEEKLNELFADNVYRRVSELEKHTATIEKDFANNPPQTRSEAKERIKRLTGLDRALTNIGKFLKKRA